MESLKTVSIPVVKIKDFQFPYRQVTEDEVVTINPEGGKIDPLALIKEMRAHRRELSDQISLIFAALSKINNPDVQEVLGSLNLTISDIHKRQFYPPELN